MEQLVDFVVVGNCSRKMIEYCTKYVRTGSKESERFEEWKFGFHRYLILENVAGTIPTGQSLLFYNVWRLDNKMFTSRNSSNLFWWSRCQIDAVSSRAAPSLNERNRLNSIIGVNLHVQWNKVFAETKQKIFLYKVTCSVTTVKCGTYQVID